MLSSSAALAMLIGNVPAYANEPETVPVSAPVSVPVPVSVSVPVPVSVPVSVPVNVPVAGSVPVSLPAPVPTNPTPLRLRHDYGAMLGMSAGVLATLNLGGRALGYRYVNFTPTSIEKNLSSTWVWDDDLFATNQFGHPYMGALFYNTARANGMGIFGSAVMTYADSLLWELALETETPSINDQLVTPMAGVLLGEASYRWSRAILWRPNGGRPGLARTIIAGVLDPIGMIARQSLGPAWHNDQPPPSFGWLALGWSGIATAFDAEGGRQTTRTRGVYAGITVSYGLPTSSRYVPRRPLDYFDARVEGSASRHQTYATLRMRGLLYGKGFGNDAFRGIAGAFGGYDFENPERLRVSTLTVGLGATVHAPLGSHWFVQGTAIISGIPYGTAGSGLPDNGTNRDYHRGPGAAQLLEVKLGRRGSGLLRATASGYELNGGAFNEGVEAIALVRVGALFSITDHHAVGLEAGYGFRHATFKDASAADGTNSVNDRSANVRLFYALIQDTDFGGGQ